MILVNFFLGLMPRIRPGNYNGLPALKCLHGKTAGILKVGDHSLLKIFVHFYGKALRVSFRRYYSSKIPDPQKASSDFSVPAENWPAFKQIIFAADKLVFKEKSKKSYPALKIALSDF